uniref:ornithine decarboxylase n=1 Tax=Angiostrongylus cantonensis TaxID=6313 RepID=A0A158P770_ANGCA
MISHMELIGDDKVEIDTSCNYESVGILDKKIDAFDLCRQIALSKNDDEDDEAFMLVDLDVVFERFALWKRELPMVEPFYAVKCNTDQVLLRTLAALGTGFDCASRNEIDIVMGTGVNAERIIYANPCKTRSFITHAKERNVTMMTFDNSEELVKVAKLHPQAEMILRIAVSDPTATCPLNLKFGADPVKVAPQLLLEAKQLHVNIVGISFHVGSGCNDPSAFREALGHARDLYDIGVSLGFTMKLIDLGGGYPGTPYHISFENIAATIRSSMDEFFPQELGVRFVAEPGRFFAASPFTLVCNVIHATEVTAEKITKDPADAENRGFMYYINDGVYGSFNCILFDHVNPVGRPLFDEMAEEYPTIIWGPTCDSLDKIEDQKHMRMLSVGDWITYPNMGAYTCSASTTFNGFQRPTAVYVVGRENWSVFMLFK